MKTRTRNLLLPALLVTVSLMVGCATEVDRLSDQLASPDWNARWTAAENLGKTKDPAAIEPLVRALEDSQPEVSNAAAESLGAIGGERAMRTLARTLLSRKADMRMLAIVGLTELGSAKSVQLIGTALKTDKVAEVRAWAAEALGMIGSSAGKGALQAARARLGSVLNVSGTRLAPLIQGRSY